VKAFKNWQSIPGPHPAKDSILLLKTVGVILFISYAIFHLPPATYQEHGCMMDLCEMVKEVVQIPVTAVGKLDIPSLAEERCILEGKADIIAVGRGISFTDDEQSRPLTYACAMR
jgi:2,4-dienoyl-CoA reductase-like NADH-dependent reductase (Old Yellow Enzyme family)